jgi:hypothetical protein
MSFNYKIFDSKLHDILKLPKSIELTDLGTNSILRDYSKFKFIRLNEIILLRSRLQEERKSDGVWSERILRFLEVRMVNINELLKLNYMSVKEREVFKEYLISFLLELCYYTHDIRFLNTAIKLNKKAKNIHADHKLYNSKLMEYLMNRI